MDDIDNTDMNLPLSAVFALLSDEYEERILIAGFIDIDTIIVTKRGSTHSMCIAFHHDTPDELTAVLYDERDEDYAVIIQWDTEDFTPENIAAYIEKCFE